MTRVSCFLPSYNKGLYAVDAIESVLDQDFDDWELFVIENSTDLSTRQVLRDRLGPALDDPRIHYDELDDLDEVRRDCYVTAWLLNQYYEQATGDFILYVSDDDIFERRIFGEVVRYFDEHPDREALYFSLARGTVYSPGDGINMASDTYPPILATTVRGAEDVDCQIDGGQVAYRTSLLARVDKPWFEESGVTQLACHADGVHLRKVAGVAPFYPLPVYGVKHRFTPLSAWTRSS